jgi:uncharacterized protein YndB with AHSA1/START domain
MTYDLKVERIIDAPPDVVFDAFVDPEAQKSLYGDDDGQPWVVESELDLRVGGTWTIEFGKEGEEPYRETNVFTQIERPVRIAFEQTMAMGEHGRRRGGRDFSTTVVVTFEGRDGKTLLTIVQTGFEERGDRDRAHAQHDGWGKILDALERVVADRTAR